VKKRVKLILWSSGVLAVISYALFIYFQPVAAPLLELRPQDVEISFTETGTVTSAVEQEMFGLIGGIVRTLPVRQGTVVNEGDLLVALDTRELKLRLKEAEGRIKSAQGQKDIALREPSPAHIEQQRLAIEQAADLVKRAEAEYERLNNNQAEPTPEKLKAQNAMFDAENLLARQKSALELLQDELAAPPGTRQQFDGLLQSLQAQKELLEYQIKNSSVYAPFAGTIRDLFVKEGAVLAPGTPLLSLFQPGNYQVEAYLLSGDMERVEPGMEVSVTYSGSLRDHHFPGKVYSVAPAAVESISALGLVERRVKVTVALEGNLAILRPGYEVDVKLVTHREEGKLAVPTTAIFTDNGIYTVWVVHNGRAALRPVKKGLETGELVVIEEGLAPGEQVIRNPRLAGLAEGKRVVGSDGI